MSKMTENVVEPKFEDYKMQVVRTFHEKVYYFNEKGILCSISKNELDNGKKHGLKNVNYRRDGSIFKKTYW